MNLIIDAGNTNVKMALFDKKLLTKKQVIKAEEIDKFELFIKKYSVYCRKLIFSSVGHADDFIGIIERYYKEYVVFGHNARIPLNNQYKSPKTLGKDRLAAVVGANALFPAHDLLVFDAGSCMTWDFVHQGENYIGGGISPGLKMRLKALNHFTARLPLIEFQNIDYLCGQDTESSILAGVCNGMIAEIEGIIGQFSIKYPEIKLIFTGGDANYFDKKLKNNIFAHPNLVLLGLNIILDLNA